MTSKKKKSGRRQSLDSMFFSLHAKEAEMVVNFFDAFYSLQFSSGLQTLSIENVANVMKYFKMKELLSELLLRLDIFYRFYGLSRAVESEFPYLCNVRHDTT